MPDLFRKIPTVWRIFLSPALTISGTLDQVTFRYIFAHVPFHLVGENRAAVPESKRPVNLQVIFHLVKLQIYKLSY